MLSGDLTRTAEVALAEGEEGLRRIGFELFRPIVPMLASAAESVGEAAASFDRASVEWMLDGIRIQLHRRGDEVRVYSRISTRSHTHCRASSAPYAASRSSRPFSTARRCGRA
jgi:ATP-dependent DNA ligase